VLWPPDQPRLAEAEVLEARSHVQECSACESYFEQDRALLDAYQRASQERAPRALRERVFDSLARERAKGLAIEHPRVLPRRWALVVAASLVGLLAGGFAVSVLGGPEAPRDGGLFAEDYLRRAVAEEKIVSSDIAEVTRFLTRELGRPIQPLQVAGLSVTSAEVCLIEGRRGAMIQYVEDGHQISHYLIPKEGTRGRDPEPAPMWGSQGGPALITWATPEIEQALVGEVSEDHLIALARAASPTI
jgi:anti-sigma factor RsiW